MSAPATGGVKEARDFTYIKPTRRRLSEYEAVTCYLQPQTEGNGPDWEQDGYLRRDNGDYAWARSSTVLDHPHWWDFRDPSGTWFRPYVRQQGEQERAIARATEDAAAAGTLAHLDPAWRDDVLAGHWAVWSYVEWGLFRSLLPPARESLAETIGMAMLLEGFDRVRHQQDVETLMLTLEQAVPGFSAGGAKDAWLGDARWQPVRKIVEELMYTVSDWAETAVAINLVFDPILSELAVSRVVGRPSAFAGDAVSQLIVSSVDRDRRRNLGWTEAFVRMVTADDVPAAAANRDAINGWLARWTGPVTEAAAGLAPPYRATTGMPATYGEAVGEVCDAQRKMVAELGLEVAS
jgi:hypothetical protein